MDCYFLQTEIGILEIKGNKEGLFSVLFATDSPQNISDIIPDSLKQTVRQLQEYFDGKRENFELKLNPQGQIFRKKYGNIYGLLILVKQNHISKWLTSLETLKLLERLLQLTEKIQFQ